MGDLRLTVGAEPPTGARLGDLDAADAAPLAYDLLTGLVSREFFDDQLTRTLRRGLAHPHRRRRACSSASATSALVNDRFGRLVGDEMLGAAAARLRTLPPRGRPRRAHRRATTFGVILESRSARDPTRRHGRRGRRPTRVALRRAALHDAHRPRRRRAAIGIAVADNATLDRGAARRPGRRSPSPRRRAAETGFRFYEAGPAGRRRPPPPAEGGARPRHRARRALPPLPAPRVAADRGDARRRSAAPLERPRARRRVTVGVHPARRGVRTSSSRSASGCSAPRWSSAPRGKRSIPGLPVVGISVNVSARQLARPGLVSRRPQRPGRDGPAPRGAPPRAHRERARWRRRGRPGPDLRPARPRRPPRPRRLRHRLVVARVPEPAAGRRVEDRPGLRRPGRHQQPGQRPRAGHHRPRPLARPDHGRRRCRAGRAGRPAATDGLLPRPGLVLRPRARRRSGHRRPAASSPSPPPTT